jgi:hypothetical protein
MFGKKDSIAERFWMLWARVEDWWLTDAWGWLVDVPMSDPGGGHCTGRRTKGPVYCRDCDGPSSIPPPCKVANLDRGMG